MFFAPSVSLEIFSSSFSLFTLTASPSLWFSKGVSLFLTVSVEEEFSPIVSDLLMFSDSSIVALLFTFSSTLDSSVVRFSSLPVWLTLLSPKFESYH